MRVIHRFTSHREHVHAVAIHKVNIHLCVAALTSVMRVGGRAQKAGATSTVERQKY